MKKGRKVKLPVITTQVRVDIFIYIPLVLFSVQIHALNFFFLTKRGNNTKHTVLLTAVFLLIDVL